MTAVKADFTDVYHQPDPRAYWNAMGALDYEIPVHGAHVARAVLDHLPTPGRRPRVADLCSSYGVMAALLNHDVSLPGLYAHYERFADADSETIRTADDVYFAERAEPVADVVGVDISEPAIRYAEHVGLHAGGVARDLETSELTVEEAALLRDVDLVTVTGGIGYISRRTFDQVLDAADTTPWVVALCLRWVDFSPVAESLAAHDLVVEQVPGYVVRQRRFADDTERLSVLAALAERGIDTAGFESGGHQCADVYLARPAAAVEADPMSQILADLR